MKHSDLNHLRRLIGWVSCEIGQTPEELVATVQNIAAKLGPVDIADAGRQRLVEAHDKAREAPAYVHAALKALRKATDTMGDVVEPVPADLHASAQLAIEALDYCERLLARETDKPSRLNVAKLAKDANKALTAAHALPAPSMSPHPEDLARWKLGFERYEKARKLDPAQWAALHKRNLAGEWFDGMVDALPPAAAAAAAAEVAKAMA